MARRLDLGYRPLAAFLLAVALTACPSTATGQVYTITPGYLYTPSDLFARQFSPSLQLVATGGPINVSGSSGAAISRDGLFLYESYRQSVPGLPDGAHLLALGNGGTIVHEIYLGAIGLDGGSGIGVDSTGTIYASAPNGLHMVSSDFSTNTILPISFGRASGVAVALNNMLYVSDQSNNLIDIIDTNHQLVGTIPTGPVPIGAAFSPDGFLYYVDTPYRLADGTGIGRLVRVDPVSLQQTVVFGNLLFPGNIAFAPDRSYYLTASNGREIDRYSANNILLGSYPDPNGNIMDGLAFYAAVPEPGSMSLVLLIATAGTLYRWQRRSRSR